MTLAFHARPPEGHWINDPNGLVRADGAYRLFCQHRADHPVFRETGWARFSSPDLLQWRFDGVAIPPAGSEWAYSGSVTRSGIGLEAVYTAHDAGLERQVHRASADGGSNWSAATEAAEFGAPAANRRDPYAFRDREGWALLLAEPCDWTDWQTQPPSRLRLYRSTDGRTWREAGAIGPWRPPGVMWEVPLFARLNGHDVLFVSEIDRRLGGAACSVRAWIGTLEESGFVPALGQPAEGQLVDRGPDFYALMAGAEGDWPIGERPFIAWLSSWQTARVMSWPGFFGGPISLPRALGVEASVSGARLTCRPLSAIGKSFSRRVDQVPLAGRASIDVNGDRLVLSLVTKDEAACLSVDWAKGALLVERIGGLPWRGESRFSPAAGNYRRVQVFVDGPVIEFFMLAEGVSASLALGSGAAPFAVTAQSDAGAATVMWDELA